MLCAPDQAAWSAALQEQQRQEAEERTAEGQQLHPQLPQAPHQAPHGSVEPGMEQPPPHLQHHLARHLHDSDAVRVSHPARKTLPARFACMECP